MVLKYDYAYYLSATSCKKSIYEQTTQNARFVRLDITIYKIYLTYCSFMLFVSWGILQCNPSYSMSTYSLSKTDYDYPFGIFKPFFKEFINLFVKTNFKHVIFINYVLRQYIKGKTCITS